MKTIGNNNLSPQLTADEKKIVEAGFTPRIKDVQDKEIYSELIKIIGKSVFEAGQVIEDSKLIGTVNSLMPDLKTYFSTMTLKEIEIACSYGVRKHYGEFMGINVTSIFNWIKSFMVDTQRQQARKKQADYILKLNEPKKLTEEEKQKLLTEGSLHLFEVFKSKGYVDDIGNATYNFLDSKGLIKFTIERKNQMVQEAMKSLKNYVSNQILTAVTQIERNSLKGQSEGFTPKSPEVLVKAKKIALNTFFKDLVDTGMELSELLDVNK